jgi:hypothetical protein
MSQSLSSPSSHSRTLLATFGLQLSVLRPGAQELDAARVRELEEEVIRLAQHRLRPGEGRIRVLEVGGRIDAPQFSHESPYWSFVPHFGHSPLM